ncbi:DNRLRE domain-containing protein [Algibacter sp. AS12]|uniref:CBM96 family carbohydrate-binding protein n=1 Tax=Algibacter sp. AS12 TaxID=3135773 RepID=UPI00398AF025
MKFRIPNLIPKMSLSIKHKLTATVFLFFSAIGFVNAQFVHPGITHKKSDLDRVKLMVEAQIDPWYTSYQDMVADSKSSYDYTVQGDETFTELGRDSGVNEGAWNNDIRAAYYNAIRWYVTGDSRHAEKAIEIFKAWSNLTSVTSGGTDSLSGGIGYIMIEAAEIIKSTYSGWAPADLQAFKDMLVYPGYSSTTEPSGNVTFYWMAFQGDPIRHGNQGLSGFRTVMAMGIFLDNEKMYDRAYRYITGELELHLNDIPYPAGPNTSTTKKEGSSNEYADDYNVSRGYTIPNYGYNEVMTNYIWENGQCQESSRDQQHTAFGIGLLTSMAEMAWNQGDDLYSHADDRLLLGLEYNMRYNVSEIQEYPDQLSPWVPTVESGEFIQQFDRTGRWYSKAISPIGIGEFSGIRTVFEMPVAHYIGRGIKTEDEAKWTMRARDKSIEISGYEKAGWTNDAIGWGGLTARRPAFCYGDPISGFETNGLPAYNMNFAETTIEAENFDYDPIQNGEGRAYHDLSVLNTGGAYRTFDGVDVEAAVGGGYHITSIESGEWLTYTISVAERAMYSIDVNYAASQAGGTMKFSFGGEEKTGDLEVPFGAPNSTSDSDWKTYTIAKDILLEAGVQSFKIMSNGTSEAFNLDSFSIAKTGIAKSDQTIQFFTLSDKVVGTADFDPGATASSGLPVSYNSSNPAVATIVDGKVHVVGVGTATITANQSGDALFNAAPSASQDLRVVAAVEGTITLNVLADTYVRDAGNANRNYGSDDNIVTVASGRYGYLKFDLSAIPGTIISAKLRIYQRTTFKFSRSIYDVADDSWEEDVITFNNRPSFENERARITTNSAWNEWDISSYVAQEYSNDKLITVVVKDPVDPEASAKGIDFRSKEFDSGSVAPVLVVEYSSESLSVNDMSQGIDLYPNPVTNQLKVSLLKSINFNDTKTQVSLYSLQGQKLMEVNPKSGEVNLDVSKLNTGIYVLMVKNGSDVTSKKIVKL